ncbi:unnamed protein product [Phaeothamnion confervicola]
MLAGVNRLLLRRAPGQRARQVLTAAEHQKPKVERLMHSQRRRESPGGPRAGPIAAGGLSRYLTVGSARFEVCQLRPPPAQRESGSCACGAHRRISMAATDGRQHDSGDVPSPTAMADDPGASNAPVPLATAVASGDGSEEKTEQEAAPRAKHRIPQKRASKLMGQLRKEEASKLAMELPRFNTGDALEIRVRPLSFPNRYFHLSAPAFLKKRESVQPSRLVSVRWPCSTPLPAAWAFFGSSGYGMMGPLPRRRIVVVGKRQMPALGSFCFCHHESCHCLATPGSRRLPRQSCPAGNGAGNSLASQRPCNRKRSQMLPWATSDRAEVIRGVVLGQNRKGADSSVLLLDVIAGEGVERRIPLHSPLIKSITVLQESFIKTGREKGRRVRRAKIYYLRDLDSNFYRVTA